MFFFGFADELTKLAQSRYNIPKPGSKVQFDSQGNPVFKRSPGPPPGWHVSPPKQEAQAPKPFPKQKPSGFIGKVKSLFQ